MLLLVVWVWLVLRSTAPEACCHFGARQVHESSRKTTPHRDHALLMMVQQDHFTSARSLTAQMRNLYGMRAGHKPLTTDTCPIVTMPIDPHGSLCWLPTTDVSAWSGHRGGKIWHGPLAAWHLWWRVQIPTSIFQPGRWQAWSTSFTWWVLPARYQAYWVQVVVVRYTSEELFNVVPNCPLPFPTDTSLVSSIGAFWETPSCHLFGCISEITTTTKMISSHFSMLDNPWFSLAGQRYQDGAACNITRLQPHGAYLG